MRLLVVLAASIVTVGYCAGNVRKDGILLLSCTVLYPGLYHVLAYRALPPTPIQGKEGKILLSPANVINSFGMAWVSTCR